MSIYNKFFAVIATLTLFGAPALADGIPGQSINRGPDPVQVQDQASQPTPPGPGCFLIEGGTAWSCPQIPPVTIGMAPTSTRTTGYSTQQTYRSAPRTTTYQSATHTPCTSSATTHNGKPCNTITRRHVKTHPPVVTKRTVTHRSVPVTKTVTHRTHAPIKTVRRVETSSAIQLDMGSFTGGVGAGVDGGFYGGGGAVVITSGSSFSRVLSHQASSFTFRSSHRGGGKKRGGGGMCCMGSGMGGGD